MKYSGAQEKECRLRGSKPGKPVLRGMKTHASLMAGQLLVGPPYSLLLCIQDCPTPPVGPRSLLPGSERAFIPVDSSAQENRSDCRRSHSLSRCTCWAWAWPSHFPLGALRATDDTCSLPRLRFLPSSHLVLTSMLPWGIWSNPASGTFAALGLPVAPRPEAGVVAEPSGTPSLDRYAGGGSPPNYRLFVICPDGRSHRHPSPHLPASVNHQRGLKDNTLFV